MKNLLSLCTTSILLAGVSFSASAIEPKVKDIQARASGEAAQQKYEASLRPTGTSQTSNFDTLNPAAGNSASGRTVQFQDETNPKRALHTRKFQDLKN